MFRKFVVGLAVFAIACAIGASGYQFGKYLKHHDQVEATADR